MSNAKKEGQKWIDAFLNDYQKYLPDIVDAFAKFYGEEHREALYSLFSNIDFYFIFNDNAYLNLKTEPEKENQVLKHYYIYMGRIINNKSKKLKGPQLFSELKRFACLNKLRRGTYYYDLLKDFFGAPTNALSAVNEDKTKYIIILPIYFLEIEILIHELNHVVSSSLAGYEALFQNEEVEELLNDLIARDITSIFAKNNSLFLDRNIKIYSLYNPKLNLVRPFYNEFKDLIKDSFIKRDVSYLEECLGAKNLKTYFSLIKRLFHLDEVSDIDKKRLDVLIFFMKEHLKKAEEKGARARQRI